MTDAEPRCRHELLSGQCAPCEEGAALAVMRASHPGPTAQVRQLVDALKARGSGRKTAKPERKVLAEQVMRAEAFLSTAHRRSARRIVAAPHEQARLAREQRRREDRLADVQTSWVTPQNVGRGKCS